MAPQRPETRKRARLGMPTRARLGMIHRLPTAGPAGRCQRSPVVVAVLALAAVPLRVLDVAIGALLELLLRGRILGRTGRVQRLLWRAGHLLRLPPQVDHLVAEGALLDHLLLDTLLQGGDVLRQSPLIALSHGLVHLPGVAYVAESVLHVLPGVELFGLDSLTTATLAPHDGLDEDVFVLASLLFECHHAPRVDRLSCFVPAPRQDLLHSLVDVAYLGKALRFLVGRHGTLCVDVARLSDEGDPLCEIANSLSPRWRALFHFNLRVLYHRVVVVPLNESKESAEEWFQFPLQADVRRIVGHKIPVDDRKQCV
mmetsp:Transcript_3576/g.9799  ORF Transcript_3576/g.9799 Transcript_3576/m.9799 type:complete len:313 (+) Transcript_3576:44-982(+)